MATTGDLNSVAHIDAFRDENRQILTFGKESPIAKPYNAQPLRMRVGKVESFW
jgi:hypothetical protein